MEEVGKDAPEYTTAAVPTCNDEELAAAALASLTYGSLKPVPSKDNSTPTTRSSHALAYNRPLYNNLVVDPFYTDYSVIHESDLAILAQFEEDPSLNGALTSCPPGIRNAWEQQLNKLKHVLGDLGPSRKNSGGVLQPFPEKLMEVLEQPDLQHIACWMPHGRAFMVNSPQLFVKEVLPRYFKQSKFMSFTRQLNLWGFKRLTRGMDNGAYYHPLFLRGRPLLCMKMKRQKVKVNGVKVSTNSEAEPNFYDTSRIRFLPNVSDSSKKQWSQLPLSAPVPYNMPSLNPSMSSLSYFLPGTSTVAHASRFFQPTPNPNSNMMWNNLYYPSSADLFTKTSGISNSGHVQNPSIAWRNSVPQYMPLSWANGPIYSSNIPRAQMTQKAEPSQSQYLNYR